MTVHINERSKGQAIQLVFEFMLLMSLQKTNYLPVVLALPCMLLFYLTSRWPLRGVAVMHDNATKSYSAKKGNEWGHDCNSRVTGSECAYIERMLTSTNPRSSQDYSSIVEVSVVWTQPVIPINNDRITAFPTVCIRQKDAGLSQTSDFFFYYIIIILFLGVPLRYQ